MAFFCADDNFKLYFDEFGDPGKPVIIFTYDLGGKRSFFHKQAAELRKDYHVITWDYRGHGAADHEHRQLNFERLAKDLANLIERLNLSKVTLAGAGAGGAIILNYIKLFGEEKISKLIFMDGTLKEIQAEDWKYGRLKNDREAIDYMKEMTYDWKNFAPMLLKKMFGEENTVEFLRKLSREESEKDKEERKWITEQFLDNNNTLMMALMVGYLTEDNRKTAEKITVPVLFTYGKDADGTYVEKERAIAGCFAHVQVKEFNRGTLHYYLDAESFNEAVKDFVGKDEC